MTLKRLLLIIPIFLFFLAPVAASESVSSYPYAPRLVKISDDAEADSLAQEGVEILRRRGDILLCLFPLRNRAVKQSLRPRRIAPALDVAKGFYDAYTVQSGSAAGIPYTGKGVVVGLCDLGIDPLHPTFLADDGHSRIKRVVQYKEREGCIIRLEGDEAYRQWQTDSVEEYHATHVCGILAGNGAGTPYSGIATDSEIVATVSTLTDVGLLLGVEDIIDYAKEVGKPAVINISVGSYTGPHDGSSLFSQYLDMCADDAVIVLSSGNEGSHTNTLFADFSVEMPSVSFRLGSKDWTQFRMYGLTDIWSGSSVPLSVTLKVFDDEEKRIVGEIAGFTLTEGESLSWNWEDASGEIPFVGELMAAGEVDSENGRHCTTIAYDFEAPIPVAGKGWARYNVVVEVTGNPGNDMEVYVDGIYSRIIGMPGQPAPSTGRTVSDLACGYKVISVGMYGNRAMVPFNAPGGELWEESTGYEDGATVIHSSYGTLRDGRVLPVTTAPGATLMSACSRHHLNAFPETPYLDLGSPWISEGGTSMASPYVAGYIATWLEAVPDLTSDDIIDIISSTNRRDIPEAADPRNANGYFDPVAGLRKALAIGGVDQIENPGAILAPEDPVTVYDMAGMKIYAGPASGLPGIRKGLYIVYTPYGVTKMALP